MKRPLLTLFVFLVWNPIFSQEITPTKADSLFRSKNWAASAKAYEKITQDTPNPKTGMTFNRLGTSYYFLGKYKEAVPAFRRAIEISRNPNVMYSLACVFNKLKQKDSCYSWLNRASQNGYNNIQQIGNDPDLSDLKSEERFKTVMQTIKINAMPCLKLPEYREFDFWIGSWNVYDSKTNQLAGTSQIKNVLDECVIMETWQPSAGADGKSFNIYNAVEKKWRQTYVDATGKLAEYYDGEFKQGAMQFKLKMPEGSTVLSRMTFYKRSNNEVQQVGEISKDSGATWETEYDLTYKRMQ